MAESVRWIASTELPFVCHVCHGPAYVWRRADLGGKLTVTRPVCVQHDDPPAPSGEQQG